MLVIGWTTRDRNIRIRLTAGDVEYAIGETDKEPIFDTIRWRFDGMRTRESGLVSSIRGGNLELKPPGASVELELLVTGPVASLWLGGQYAGSYHTIDSAPIEGHIGFGTSRGSVAIAPAVVTRLDREPVAILDLVRGTGPELARAQNVGVFFAKDFEVPSNGALVLWVPALSKSGSVQEGNEDADEREIARFKRSAGKLLDRMSRNSVSQPLVLALPERYDGKFS
ncbi:MAG: hypothetical protein AAGG01_15800, partial [Planctomycetota bacterium]